MKTLVVGGGILGTWIATHLRARSHSVAHLERDASPRGASIQNLGLIWISGRAPGRELEIALAARDRWRTQRDRWPELPFREAGSLTLAPDLATSRALEAAAALPDADARGFALLGAEEITRRFGLEARGLPGLYAAHDAVTEPQEVLGVMRGYLAQDASYEFCPNAKVIGCTDHEVVLADHRRLPFDVAFFATGAADLATLGFGDGGRLIRTQLQMLETTPSQTPLEPAVADTDSFRYYPAYAPIRHLLPPQEALASTYAAQLLVARRSHGGLTIGDTHQPFGLPFLEADVEDYLRSRTQELLGIAVPRTSRRWLGVYSQLPADDGDIYFVHRPYANVVWVSGLAGRGMTIAPEVAHQVVKEVMD